MTDATAVKSKSIKKSGDDYFWCGLKNGSRETCGYIEARGAKMGAMVEMIELDGDFWEVTKVGEGVSKAYVRQQEKRFKSFQGSLKGGGIQ